MSTPSTKLPINIAQGGVAHFPGTTPESKALAESLLEKDRDKYHCFFNHSNFHNHLSHHILAAYDLGAPATLLQAIYESEETIQRPIDLPDSEATEEIPEITEKNWTEFLGKPKFYASYLSFFTSRISVLGASKTIEQYIFAPAANGNGSHMLLRLVVGAYHPCIQLGYGVEFKSDAMIAQGIAQAAVHFVIPVLVNVLSGGDAAPAQGQSLFAILRSVYDSPILKPVMPYDPDALLSTRLRDAMKDGRPAEIRRISALWFSASPPSEEDLRQKLAELFFVSTLLLCGTSKPNRTPRLDFFLMHILNSSLFLPSLLPLIPRLEDRVRLLQTLLPTYIMFLILRGRPRIDAELVMAYSASPHPPVGATTTYESIDTEKTDAIAPGVNNPWPIIISSALQAPDAHTVKAIRTLYYAAQKYGHTPAGGVPGCVGEDGKETIKGLQQVDGTVFVRAAGVVLDIMGWMVDGNLKAGSWDRSGLGWDDAWNDGK